MLAAMLWGLTVPVPMFSVKIVTCALTTPANPSTANTTTILRQGKSIFRAFIGKVGVEIIGSR